MAACQDPNPRQVCTNLAQNLDFEGAIAQLGERLNGIQEVVGSSPTSSTSKKPRLSRGFCFVARFALDVMMA
jgi:hypothetical protein